MVRGAAAPGWRLYIRIRRRLFMVPFFVVLFPSSPSSVVALHCLFVGVCCFKWKKIHFQKLWAKSVHMNNFSIRRNTHVENSLIMLGFERYLTLSNINYLELSLGESKLKYPKLKRKNYPSSFEWSKYHKLTKCDPLNHQKFTSYEN